MFTIFVCSRICVKKVRQFFLARMKRTHKNIAIAVAKKLNRYKKCTCYNKINNNVICMDCGYSWCKTCSKKSYALFCFFCKFGTHLCVY